MTTNIQCVNIQGNCQHFNKLSDHFCTNCGIPLVKRYLFALSDKITTVGEKLADRYVIVKPGVLLDTLPAMTPETTDEVPQEVVPYLKLFVHRLHIPQVYGFVTDSKYGTIWLLEDGPICHEGEYAKYAGQLMPTLNKSWQRASALRQLHWLWQIAKLWGPMQNQGVVNSLLQPELLRVEGGLLKVLYLLLPDKNNQVGLPDLAQFLSRENFIDTAQPIIKDFLENIFARLTSGEIDNAEELMRIIDGNIEQVKNDLKLQYNYNVIAYSDQGPKRQRNEDSCYPRSGQTNKNLAIVCDGIGGHEGGDVASNMAIETLITETNKIKPNNQINLQKTFLQVDPRQQLENAVKLANDRICERNDQERRSDRGRMGTTVVMTLGDEHQVYIAHVGDSRVYRISKTGCHQVTLDDDVASREVRLGYYLYRDTLQHSASGALVQALGMSPSGNLHPNVQRLITDEECIFLLCSDGLSDYDRVDQYWEKEILPILTKSKNISISDIGRKLIEIANTKNGHDNVTVGLVHCQITGENWESTLLDPDENNILATKINMASITVPTPSANNYPATTIQTPPQQNPSPYATRIPGNNSILNIMRSPLVIGLWVVAIALGGAVAYKKLVLDKQAQNPSEVKPTPTVTNTPEKKEVKLERGKFINLGDDIQLTNIKNSQKPPVLLPSNSIIQILEVHPKGEGENKHNLVKLEICLDGGATSAKKPVKGTFVIEESDLKGVEIKEEENTSDYGNCQEIDPESKPKKPFPKEADARLSKQEKTEDGNQSSESKNQEKTKVKDKTNEVKPKEENKSSETGNPDDQNNIDKGKKQETPPVP